MRKSQWATPAGIDHDYNYLKSVERRIEHASQDVKDRGIGQDPANRRATRQWQPDSGLQRYLFDHRITIERAPPGMSRQKANKTRVTNKGKVFWTVELVEEDGSHHLDHDVSELNTMSEIYSALLSKKAKAESRQQNMENSIDSQRKKRKRDNGDVQSAISTIDKPGSDQKLPVSATALTQQLSETGTTGDSKPQSSEHSAGKDAPSHEFYLLKPATASTLRVLVPLIGTSTLICCLEGQLLLEYPTIYVLSRPPDSLGPNFQLEEDYLASQRQEQLVDETPFASAVPIPQDHGQTLERSADGALKPSATDQILGMLKRNAWAK